ncbi:hypothetical protein BKI52_22060 [marine bacterium AO1-C]|nr:hypothetical protein BKI52_22060 [marine bacterium AO1-C]
MSIDRLKKISFLLIGFISICCISPIQSQNLGWAQSLGSSGNSDQGDHIVTDQNGNIYLIGLFGGTVDFDLTTNKTELTSQGTSDAFFAKYNAQQELQWVKSISSDNSVSIAQIRFDNSGNIYLVGTFGGTTDFDPGASTANLSSAGQDDVFVAKYNASGEYQWAFKIGGSSFDFGEDLVLDNTGNIYITGAFQGNNIDFDPGTSTQNLSAVGTSSSMFLAKYSNDGSYQWAFSVGSSEASKYMSVSGIALNSSTNELIVVGEQRGTVDYDPGMGTTNLTEANGTVFIAKYDTNGNYVLAKNFGSTDARSLTLDNSGNIYICGSYTGSNVDFDPGTGTSNLTSQGNNDWFIAKYNSSIELQWVQGMGSPTGSDFPESIALDTQNNVFVVGLFSGEFAFNEATNSNKISSSGSADVLLASYDTNGKYRFAHHMGGSDFDAGNDVHINSNNNGIYLTGYFTGTANFAIDGSTSNLTSNGGQDIFFALYGEPEINVTLNGKAVTSGNTINFGDIANGSNSADSIFTIENLGTLDLTLTGTAGSLVQLSGTHTSDFVVSQTNVISPIGAGNSVTFSVKFSPSAVGDRNAVLSISSNDADEGTYTINLKGNGTDVQTSLAQNPSEGLLLIGPNPFHQQLNIRLSQTNQSMVQYQFVDQTGKAILQQSGRLVNGNLLIDTTQLNSGHYTLIINFGKEKIARKIIKH